VQIDQSGTGVPPVNRPESQAGRLCHTTCSHILFPYEPLTIPMQSFERTDRTDLTERTDKV